MPNADVILQSPDLLHLKHTHGRLSEEYKGKSLKTPIQVEQNDTTQTKNETIPLPVTRTCHRMRMGQERISYYLQTIFGSLSQHRDVPRLRRNVLHLCAKIFTFQYVHLHAELAIVFLDMFLESLQVLVVKLLRCRDGLGKSVIVVHPKAELQPKAVF